MSYCFAYVIGEPGVGKTTLVEAAIAGLREVAYERPFAHLHYPDARVWQLGRRRGTFSGTDGLGMAVQLVVVGWLPIGPPFVLAEGDRLANPSFFRAVRAAGYSLDVVHVVATEATARERRDRRAEETGKAQNDSWVKGRRTKSDRLARGWSNVSVSSEQPIEDQLAQLADVAVFAALAEARSAIAA